MTATKQAKRDAKIARVLAQAMEILGPYACSDDNPCGTIAHYDDEEPILRWRISCEGAWECYATARQLLKEARRWRECYEQDERERDALSELMSEQWANAHPIDG